ncbi:MAG: hypothetical protein IMZ52_05210 [Actinobacteria bacterium]|nr:hypothetical protein [Actinomycetota bacterium]MBE3114613.1 hypothetical protein [Actinomycetota bacterium]
MILPDKDLRIYYSGNSYVEGRCSRFDVQDYSIIVETWLKKSDFNNLNNNIRPNAVKELYKILGRPKFIDTSWQGKNTIRLSPVVGTQLHNMRNQVTGYVKNINSVPLESDKGWLNVKLECYTSSNSL